MALSTKVPPHILGCQHLCLGSKVWRLGYDLWNTRMGSWKNTKAKSVIYKFFMKLSFGRKQYDLKLRSRINLYLNWHKRVSKVMLVWNPGNWSWYFQTFTSRNWPNIIVRSALPRKKARQLKGEGIPWWCSLTMQGTLAQSLVQADYTCHGANKSTCHTYWACALKPKSL